MADAFSPPMVLSLVGVRETQAAPKLLSSLLVVAPPPRLLRGVRSVEPPCAWEGAPMADAFLSSMGQVPSPVCRYRCCTLFLAGVGETLATAGMSSIFFVAAPPVLLPMNPTSSIGTLGLHSAFQSSPWSSRRAASIKQASEGERFRPSSPFSSLFSLKFRVTKSSSSLSLSLSAVASFP